MPKIQSIDQHKHQTKNPQHTYIDTTNIINHASHITQTLASEHNLRHITDYRHIGDSIIKDGIPLLNLTSNDYLGLARLSYCIISPQYSYPYDTDIHKQKAQTFATRFWDFIESQNLCLHDLSLGAGSSRLLSGGGVVWECFEAYLRECFAQKYALLFNSGYHLNVSCIATLGRLEGVGILIDEYAHASMFDGILQAKSMQPSLWWRRFKHNDISHLQELLESHSAHFRYIIILSEGLFSMDGDVCDLAGIIALKNRYDNVLIYLDEAHSVGVLGDNGLGLAESVGLIDQVDFLIYTFGKALGSVGACILCAKELRELFVNRARGLIYSTALPPLNVAFSFFTFCELRHLQAQREYLRTLSKQARHQLESIIMHKIESSAAQDSIQPYIMGDWHIISLVLGENSRATQWQNILESNGIFAKAIKTPTIPHGTARIRLSLNATHSHQTLTPLYHTLQHYADHII